MGHKYLTEEHAAALAYMCTKRRSEHFRAQTEPERAFAWHDAQALAAARIELGLVDDVDRIVKAYGLVENVEDSVVD